VSLIVTPQGTFTFDPDGWKWTAEATVSASGELGLSSTACVGNVPDDPALVQAMFMARYGNMPQPEQSTALNWYTEGYCAGTVSLGRFEEYTKTGYPYLNVQQPQIWTPWVNGAYVQGNIDGDGEFVLATDPRYMVPSSPGYTVPPGKARALGRYEGERREPGRAVQ
jgi:hypothetical protein